MVVAVAVAAGMSVAVVAEAGKADVGLAELGCSQSVDTVAVVFVEYMDLAEADCIAVEVVEVVDTASEAEVVEVELAAAVAVLFVGRVVRQRLCPLILAEVELGRWRS